MASSSEPDGARRGGFSIGDTLEIGPIAPQEIESAVLIFFGAFRDNVRVVYGDNPRPQAMVDVWTFARSVEPGGFLAARLGAGLVGYALFTSSVGRLERRALASGQVIVWATRAIAGRYGLRWSSLARQLWNKLLFVGSSGEFRTKGDAQLLNIAVAPTARGHGVGGALVRAGMHYLASADIDEVRLEVSPSNAAAIAIYRNAGFQERGRLRNIHGEWLVMMGNPAAI